MPNPSLPRPQASTAKAAKQTVAQLWKQIQADYAKIEPAFRVASQPYITYTIEPGMPRYDVATQAVAVLKAPAPPAVLDAEIEGVIATAMGVNSYWTSPVRAATIDTLLAYWGALGGPAFVIDAMVATLRWKRQLSGGAGSDISIHWNTAWETPANLRVEHIERCPGPWANLRLYLSTLSPDDFQKARSRAEQLRAEGSLSRRSALSYAFGDADWAHQDALDTLQQGNNRGCHLLTMACAEADAALMLQLIGSEKFGWERLDIQSLPTIVTSFGGQAPEIVDALWQHERLEIPRKSKAKASAAIIEAAVAEAIGSVVSPFSIAWMAQHANSPACTQAVAAFASLNAPVVAAPVAVAAPSIALPTWLDTVPTPWLKQKSPAFWSATSAPPLLLKAGGQLSLAQMDAVRMMLAQSSAGADEITQLCALCTQDSLDAFALFLMDTWIAVGAPPRERWAIDGTRLLLNPAPASQAAVDARFFTGKVWFIYGSLKAFNSKQLQPLLQARGARVVSSVSAKVQFLVQAGPTPAPSDWVGASAQQARAVGAEILGEAAFLRILHGYFF